MAFYSLDNSAEQYAARRRRWTRQMGEITDPETGAIVGGEVAAFGSGGSAWSAISIGVATGALTFLVTRFLDSMFFSKGKR